MYQPQKLPGKKSTLKRRLVAASRLPWNAGPSPFSTPQGWSRWTGRRAACAADSWFRRHSRYVRPTKSMRCPVRYRAGWIAESRTKNDPFRVIQHVRSFHPNFFRRIAVNNKRLRISILIALVVTLFQTGARAQVGTPAPIVSVAAKTPAARPALAAAVLREE